MFGGGVQFCDSYVSMWMIENFNVNMQLNKVYCELQMEKIRKLFKHVENIVRVGKNT
jgi:hypothetical protein